MHVLDLCVDCAGARLNHLERSRARATPKRAQKRFLLSEFGAIRFQVNVQARLGAPQLLLEHAVRCRGGGSSVNPGFHFLCGKNSDR